MQAITLPSPVSFRTQLRLILHDGRGRLGHAFNFLLVVLILVSVAILPLELLPTYHAFDQAISMLESVIIALFTVEYGLRIYSAEHRAAYIFSLWGIIDALSIVPFYAGLFGTEYVRVLRLIRFFKLGEIDAAASVEDADTMERGMGLVEGEQVQYVVTKHPLYLFLGCIPPTLAASFAIGILFAGNNQPVAISVATILLLFAFVLLWKTWLDFSYDVIYLTNYRLIFVDQNLLGRSINQMNYSSITNVKPFYPSIISYIFRYGSLIIDTAAEHPGQVSISMIRRHEEAAHVIMQKCFQTKEI